MPRWSATRWARCAWKLGAIWASPKPAGSRCGWWTGRCSGDDKSGALIALHHPFTAPQNPDPQALANDPDSALSQGYDVVLNGIELGGGSVRIHDAALQATVFKLLGISDEEAREKFGFLLDALQYGAPPHGGIALGLDRMVMLMVGAASIREVIAFPKTQTASCPLTDAPGLVDHKQLRELSIKSTAQAKTEV